MDKINKDFDGVSWEWKGKTAIRDLKSICPKCKYKLDITMTGLEIKEGEVTKDGRLPITISTPDVLYLCPKCSFSVKTNIDDVNNPKDLRKVVLKEFEHRQRLKASENTKD